MGYNGIHTSALLSHNCDIYDTFGPIAKTGWSDGDAETPTSINNMSRALCAEFVGAEEFWRGRNTERSVLRI